MNRQSVNIRQIYCHKLYSFYYVASIISIGIKCTANVNIGNGGIGNKFYELFYEKFMFFFQ